MAILWVATGRPDHGRDPELARQDGRVRGRPAGVGDEPGDLGEQDDPGRVGHLADQDVAVADVVEVVDRADDPRDPLDDPRRARDAADRVVVGGLLPLEALG